MDSHEQIQRAKDFLDSFYEKKIHSLISQGITTLVIDFADLVKHDPEMADYLLEHPEDTIRGFELALEGYEVNDCRVRFNNLRENQYIAIRNIRSANINKLMYIEGIVRQSSDVRPQITSAKFECPSCGNTISILQLETRFKEPTRCTCGRRGKFRLISKHLVDAQRLVLEEAPETLEGGEQPKRLSVFLKEDLVEPKMEKKTTPGSKVRVFGIVKEVPILLKSGAQSIRYDLMMDSNYIEPIDEAYQDIEIDLEEEKQIKELSKDIRVYERFIQSIAPSIFGYDDVKEAIVLQLMGGVRKKKEDGTATRGDLHVLLVGDPGSGKSQILTFVSKIAPKARFVSGKGASAAGLTASVVKDEFLKGWALEAGAMVLANDGYCCIDELDKMSVEDTSALHEALEQQRISISKANIQACYSEDTEVLTEEGWKRYNEVKNLKIAQYDPSLKIIQFLSHNGLYVYNYAGEMFHFKSKRNDILVTPNHKMLLKKDKSGKFEFINAENITFSRFRFLNSGNFKGKERKFFILPPIKNKQNRKHKKYTNQEKPQKIPFDLWLEFLGYYVSEGGLQKRAAFGIPQKKGEKANKIKKCLLKLSKYVGFTLSESKEGKYIRFQITNTQLFDYLEKNCGKKYFNKRLNLNFSDISKSQLKILFDAMMVGDGSSDGKSYSSASKELIDQFQVIACLIGKSASLHIQYDDGYRGKRVRLYRVCLSERTQPEIKREHIKKLNYKCNVFCFATKTGFFITRRNGKVAIQGNTLMARTTVLAAANPKLGRFDPYAPIASQINLPPALINRFDLIFPIRDIPNREKDKLIASHVLRLQQKPSELKSEIDSKLFRKYLTYAKRKINPVLTDAAIDEIMTFYIDLRNTTTAGNEQEIKPIPISARQLEALVRLSEGSARVRLSKKVTRLDAKRAIRLLRHCLMQVGIDPETGQFDIDRMSTGISSSQRSRIVVIREIISELDKKFGKNIPVEEIIAEASEKGIDETHVQESIEKLKREGEIFEPKAGYLSRIT
ncbi:AAA family ATPase [Candidatus Woesearchaeota archaeon]|nr:AAA family ATPase [Candidatus Woesearchaeota archaeon]